MMSYRAPRKDRLIYMGVPLAPVALISWALIVSGHPWLAIPAFLFGWVIAKEAWEGFIAWVGRQFEQNHLMLPNADEKMRQRFREESYEAKQQRKRKRG
jgi:hypothetical protein